MSNPFISVILPTRDRLRWLPRAVSSVLQQSFRDFELVIVDDGSTDGTREWVAALRDSRTIYVHNVSGSGDAAARNLGVKHARGTWLAFQDSDDEWAAHKLAVQATMAQESPGDVALIGSALLRVTPHRVEPIHWPLRDTAAESGDVDPSEFLAGFRAYLQSVLIRRTAFDAAGGFDTNLKARSDFDFCLRLTQRHRAIASKDILAVSYESEDGISLHANRRLHDIRCILEKHATLIGAHRRANARYRYDLGKAELACGQRLNAARAAFASAALEPWRMRTWALLALSVLGAGALRRVEDLRQLRTRAGP